MTTQENLTANEDRVVQSCFEETHRRLHYLGFDATFSTEMSEWVSMIENAPRRAHINPSFNPRHSDVSADNAFWIRLIDIESEQPIACIANRMFVTDDYLELMRSQLLWFRNPPATPIDIVPDSLPRIAGRVGHHGGLWIHPDFRKHGLSGFMTRLARCGSLRRWNVDWHCGLVVGTIAEKGLATTPVTGYGYPHMALVVDGRQPITDHHERLFVPWISRAEILSQLADETARLIGHGNQQAVWHSATS
jgi:hypothetical protein